MLAPEMLSCEPEHEKALGPQGVLPAELEFHESYAWCLNPHLTVREAIVRLRDEIDRLITQGNAKGHYSWLSSLTDTRDTLNRC